MPESSRPYVQSYIPKLVGEGHTAESAFNAVTDAGLEIDREHFDSLWGEAVYQLQLKETQSQLPLNRKIAPTEFGTATRPYARGPLVNVSLAVYDPTTDDYTFHVWGVRSREPMTPAWYIQKAVDDWLTTQKGGRNTPEGAPIADASFIDSAVMLVGEEEG